MGSQDESEQTMTRREAIIENAKYLREVRPIDPDEIYEYVDEQPHPAVVRQVLREVAVSLRLRERADGTFIPVDESPPEPTFEGVDALPEAYADRLDDLLVDRYGAEWAEGESGHKLRAAIDRLKDAYYRQADVEYDETAALGYAIYHLAGYYAVTQHLFARLARAGRLDRCLRILDIGAGVGGPAAGIAELLGDEAVVEYHAVEPSPAGEVLLELAEEFPRNVRLSLHETTAESFKPDRQYDIILFANVLNELDQPTQVLRSYLDVLAEDGSLVAIAPADRNTSIDLRQSERAVADDGPATVYAPTVRLWPNEQPTAQCWSFDVQPDLSVPPFQRRLQDGAREDDDRYCNVDVQYSPVVLRLDGDRAVEFHPDRSRFAKLGESDDLITQRIDAAAIKLSHDLTDTTEANPLYLVGDGSQSVDHYAVLTRETSLNEDLSAAGYGDLLLFEGVLVLWNDDEGAINLVVDEETVVDTAPAEGAPPRRR